jgi:outer membrane protein OmpA-like peptidoglycan-associated protein
MMTTTRRWSYPVVAGLAIGSLLLAGCASLAKSDPPALAPTRPLPAISQPLRLAADANGDELEPGAANARAREPATAQRVTMKSFKAVDWSPKMLSMRTGDAGGAFAVPGAVAAVGAAPAPEAPAPVVFAERRASEALDRLEGVITIRHEKRGAVITLASDRLVDSGQWALTSSGQYGLRELAAALRDQGGRTILIQGFTDSMGAPAVNDALSLRRAETIRDFFVKEGVPAERLRAEGLGAKRPVAPNGTADGRAQNRRIEIVIAP